MKTTILAGLVAGALAAPLAGAGASGAPGGSVGTGTGTVAEAGNRFAMNLYGQLAREMPGRNLIFSPASISMALTMTAAGARGRTGAEMERVLQLTGQLRAAHAGYRALLERWNGGGADRGYQLRVANRLWGQQGYGFLPEYLRLTGVQYSAPLGLVDFSRRTEQARAEINRWVEQKTEKRIANLLPRGVLDELTRLVLVNAIYFKGDWMTPFRAEATSPAPFWVSESISVPSRLMHGSAQRSYCEDAAAQVVELPYRGDDLSMLVIVPRGRAGLATVEAGLSADRVAAWRARLASRRVDVYLPKFKLETEAMLKRTLSAMGVRQAFTQSADFSGMNGKKDLYVGAVVHKAFVDVNEAGTEAAAATAVVMQAKSAMIGPPPAVVRADHPFLFAICDRRTGALLFMGRLSNPSAG